MSYAAAVERLLALGHELHATPSHKFDLGNMRVLLEALAHPERKFSSVLIAGTNGKGSTAATLASILEVAGHRTGLYTSPHLLRVNERIRVMGEEISDDEFAKAHERVEEAAQKLVTAGSLPWHPSFFEMLTAMAFEHFARTGVRLAVLEVGMGGRLDATNVVEPVLSVITDIALDHQKFLGNTIAEIAREKAGIIRPGGVVVTLPQHPEANDVLGNTILERDARGVNAVPYVPPVSPGSELETRNWKRETDFRSHYPLEVLGSTITVDSPLAGRHQLRNLALAIAAAVELNAQGFALTARDVERGIRETRWRGRLEMLPAAAGRPAVLLDAAHNPAGAWALRAALSELAGEQPVTLVFAAMRDKAIGEMAEILFPVAAHVVATRAQNPRSATPDEVRAAAARLGQEIAAEPDVPAALRRAFQFAGPDGLVVVAGSIYIIGEAIETIESVNQ
ncbi:MAG TPA: folylpolyglutamate synthase/dihydrofolate synthase family protein [Terriglobales bacterium]|nr:folylpolyglutamate synthase/dihydrofolate synthase family protein [Terriglobales bacterium]